MTQKLYSLKASLHVICDKHMAYFRDYLNVALEQCSSTFLSSWNPDILSCLSLNPHQQKCKKTRITCKKIKHFVLDISTNKQLLQKVKNKKFNDLIN